MKEILIKEIVANMQTFNRDEEKISEDNLIHFMNLKKVKLTLKQKESGQEEDNVRTVISSSVTALSR